MSSAGLGSGVTRYGASDQTLESASGVLRARAARHGLTLAEATVVDLAASAVAADAWVLITAARGLDHASRKGETAAGVLAAILARAAGAGSHLDEDALLACEAECAEDPFWAGTADQYAAWVRHVAGLHAPAALRAAAEDLASAGPGTGFSAFAALLLLLADDDPSL